jgi:hypothetical protein
MAQGGDRRRAAPITVPARCYAVEGAWSRQSVSVCTTYTVCTSYCFVTAGHRRGNEAVAEAGLQDLIGGNGPSPSRRGTEGQYIADLEDSQATVTASFGSSAERDAVPSSRRPVPAAICPRQRISRWLADRLNGLDTRQHTPVKDEQSSNSGRRRGRVGSHVGRGSSWLAGPVCSPARSSMSTAGLRGAL